MEITKTIKVCSSVRAFAVSNDGKFVIVGASASLSRWHIASREKRTEFFIRFAIGKMAFSESGDVLYIGESAKPARVFAFDAFSLDLISEMYRHNSPVSALLLLRRFDLLVSGADGELIPRSLRGRSRRKLRVGDGAVSALAATASERSFFAGFAGARLIQFDSATLKQSELPCGDVGVSALCLYDDDRRLAVGGVDRRVRLFDAETRALLAELADRPGIATSLCTNAGDRHLIAGYSEGKIEIFDGNCERALYRADASAQGYCQLEHVDAVGLMVACESGCVAVCEVTAVALGQSRRRLSAVGDEPRPRREKVASQVLRSQIFVLPQLEHFQTAPRASIDPFARRRSAEIADKENRSIETFGAELCEKRRSNADFRVAFESVKPLSAKATEFKESILRDSLVRPRGAAPQFEALNERIAELLARLSDCAREKLRFETLYKLRTKESNIRAKMLNSQFAARKSAFKRTIRTSNYVFTFEDCDDEPIAATAIEFSSEAKLRGRIPRRGADPLNEFVALSIRVNGARFEELQNGICKNFLFNGRALICKSDGKRFFGNVTNNRFDESD